MAPLDRGGRDYLDTYHNHNANKHVSKHLYVGKKPSPHRGGGGIMGKSVNAFADLCQRASSSQ